MPNWTTCTLTMRGIGTNAALYSDTEDGKRYFDFNKIIPEPKTPEECVEKYGERYLDHVDENGNSAHALMHTDDDSWFNWYDWHCDFWNTKWGACDTRVEGPNTVVFDTAWDAPYPIFEKLSELFPNELLHTKLEFEGEWGVLYHQIYKGGICIDRTEEHLDDEDEDEDDEDV